MPRSFHNQSYGNRKGASAGRMARYRKSKFSGKRFKGRRMKYTGRQLAKSSRFRYAKPEVKYFLTVENDQAMNAKIIFPHPLVRQGITVNTRLGNKICPKLYIIWYTITKLTTSTVINPSGRVIICNYPAWNKLDTVPPLNEVLTASTAGNNFLNFCRDPLRSKKVLQIWKQDKIMFGSESQQVWDDVAMGLRVQTGGAYVGKMVIKYPPGSEITYLADTGAVEDISDNQLIIHMASNNATFPLNISYQSVLYFTDS